MERQFRLAGLLRLRRLEEERAAAELAVANAQKRAAERRRDELSTLMGGSSMPARSGAPEWQAAVAARAALTGMVDEADIAVAVAVRRGEIVAAEWTGARTRVAMIDKLAERHEALVRAEDERAEQLLLDEAASRRRAEEDR